MRTYHLLILLATFLAATPLHAGFITAADFSEIDTTSTSFTFPTFDATVGWEFTVNSTVTVARLGYYDHGQDGLADSHEVAIWSLDGFNGTLLRSVVIPAGTSAALDGHFRFEAISPLTLVAGVTYVIGAETGHGTAGSMTDDFDPVVTPTATGFSHISEISTPAGRFGTISPPGSGFADNNYPSDSGGVTDRPFFGPTFQLETQEVPEPSSLLLILLGVPVFSVARRRSV